jgi:glycosyltransferase involved in cell wall biosynthesis
MQKTNFDFEAIIGDDCSTDGTVEIIRDFAKRYPKIIKPVFREKNIGATKNYLNILSSCKGQYIAVCEGDDFFTDIQKLQIQADYMDKNPDCSLCFHPTLVIFENKEEKDYCFPAVHNQKLFTLNKLIIENFIQTNSVMYRRQEYKSIPTDIIPGDWFVHIYHARLGRIGFINRVMSTYRKHAGGIWWNSYKNQERLYIQHGVKHMDMYFELLKLFQNRPIQKKLVLRKMNDLVITLIKIDKKYTDTRLLETLLISKPIEMANFYSSYHYLFEEESNRLQKFMNRRLWRLMLKINDFTPNIFKRAIIYIVSAKNKIIEKFIF